MQPLPVGATDAHVTLHDADEALGAYRAEMARTGLSRCVLIQPRAGGEHQAGMLAALAALGPAARGVAIVPADLPGPELDLLGAQGICGLRCLLGEPNETLSADGTMSWEDVAHLAPRAAERGWHLELSFDPAEWKRREALIATLPAAIVLAGRAAPDPDGPEAAALRRTLDSGNVWIKLPVEPRRARAIIRSAADRCLWGSCWPAGGTQLDAKLAPLADESAATRARILATNPAMVYGFG